jgi:hypothetical protein
METLSLAAVGWVADDPTGNRLRWSWPGDAAEAGHHLLPARILVERAPLTMDHEVDLGSKYVWAALVPSSLWKGPVDVTLTGAMPVELALGGPVQAVSFLYRGTPALVQAFNGGRCVITRPVSDGESVVLQSAALDLLTITASACELQALRTLDLYAPTTLNFEVIATVDLSATGTAAFADAATRYPASPTLDQGKWAQLQKLWTAAWAEAPNAPAPGGKVNQWAELQLTLGARWEHAVFCGLGFVDGPDNATPALDSWGGLLEVAADVAYRVRDADGDLGPSNIVLVPGGPAPDLPLLQPGIEGGAVRLGKSDRIRASWDLVWQSPDPGIVGVQVDETLSVGTDEIHQVYTGRGRRENDPPGAGFLYRDEEVASHAVTVVAGIRAQDGFDRLGPLGPVLHQKLPIDHHPQPPPLRSATYDEKAMRATLVQPDPGDWKPDKIVAAAPGTVDVYRRVTDPARFSAPVQDAIPAGADLAVTLLGSPPPDPGAFIGGQITIGAVKGMVREISWPVVSVAVPYGGGPVPALVLPATAEILQAPTHPSLFVPVHSTAASGVQQHIDFVDPLPDPVSAELVEYRLQVAFAGQFGPLGPPVQAIRLPPTPKIPPAFTMIRLGVDFYRRTVVQLDLAEPCQDALEIWWAEGNVPATDFLGHAVPGDAGPRLPEGGTTLFDTLSLPIPDKVSRVVTIGLQAANAADGRSAFKTVVHTLPAS